jgi:hypothetical protein
VFPEILGDGHDDEKNSDESSDKDEQDMKTEEGQEGANGAQNMEEEADQLTAWLSEEQQLDDTRWLPARTTTENIDEQDPEAVVLFDGTSRSHVKS